MARQSIKEIRFHHGLHVRSVVVHWTVTIHCSCRPSGLAHQFLNLPTQA